MERLQLIHSSDSSNVADSIAGGEAQGNNEKGDATGQDVAGASSENEAKARDGGSKSISQKKWQARKAKILIFVKMGLLLFISSAYFTASLVFSFHLAGILSSAPKEANYSGMRRMLLRTAMFNLRMQTTGSGFGGYTVTNDMTTGILGKLKKAHEALMYGDTGLGIPGFMRGDEVMKEQKDLLMHDACLGWPATSPFTAVQCRQFENGIMKAG